MSRHYFFSVHVPESKVAQLGSTPVFTDKFGDGDHGVYSLVSMGIILTVLARV
ncbi:hypothetical protein JCM19235_1367 [Vibrio maritimus]|uniref:Uncharacterized protein n=1 Tax=Vibrio maritimus TaxID=990268 RepID=A0A090S699_9VIBR|nr:hypothetical protein JCM19235_1367 [Vibrio maritimus]